METMYLVCAIGGCTLIGCQFLLSLVGLGGHEFGHDAGHDLGHDVGHDTGQDHAHDSQQSHASTWIFSWLTLRTLSAALAFFGLTGLAAQHTDLDAGPTLLLALAGGLSALMTVGWLMRTLSRLNADGTARIERSLGSQGTVYLSIPGQRAGAGKVHVSCQNRLLEYKAVTAHASLATGAKIVVVSVISGDTVEVAPAPETEKVSHV